MKAVSTQWTLGALFVILLLDLLAFTCILPLFPSILDFYGTEPHRDWLYIECEQFLHTFRQAIGAPKLARFESVFFGGLLGSLFSALQFLSSPLLGTLSDVFGRKSILFFSVLGSFSSYLLWSFADTFTLFALSRIVGGLSKASVSVVIAVIVDICPDGGRGRGMALVGMAFSCAFLFGPMIGAFFAKKIPSVSSLTHITPAYFAMGATLLEIVCILSLLRETLPVEKRRTKLTDIRDNWLSFVSPKSLFNFSLVSKSLDNGAMKSAQDNGRIYFIYLFLYSGLEFTLSFFTHLRFGYDSMQQGRMYLFIGLLMIFFQGCCVRKISIDYQRIAALWGLGIIIPSFIIVGLATNHIALYCGLVLYSLGT